jgi:hypothetical protein
MKSRLTFTCAGALCALWCNLGHAVVLYNGPAGTAPETQGWLTFQSAGGTPLRITAGGKTMLDTTSSDGIQAGYGNYNLIFPVNPNFPTLNRMDGFVVSLDMKLLTESHASNNRSGVSLIALSQDLFGIEIAFWPNEVWVQSGPDFLHAEGAAFDTTAAFSTYDVTIKDNAYSIFANGNQILTGSLRNYSAFGLPYTLPNFIFLGDDTTSARGNFEFSRLAVVPEPHAWLVGACGIVVGWASRPRFAGLSGR